MYNKEKLISLIREKALSFGQFRLSSDKISVYYVDLSKIIMYQEGLYQIIAGLHEIINMTYDSVGGPAMGAIPLATALMLHLPLTRSFFVRPESKTHGKRDTIDGNLQKGDNVLMVEDVVTTGQSLYKAIKEVEDFGGIVKEVYCVLDRQTDGKEFLKSKGYDLISLLNISDILEK